jgi:hypothetical protein
MHDKKASQKGDPSQHPTVGDGVVAAQLTSSTAF